MKVKKEFHMSTKRMNHFSAQVHTARGREAFRMTDGIRYYLRQGVHCIEAVTDQGEGFYVYLPVGIESGIYQLQIGLPSVIHVTQASEAELYPLGTLTLTVEGDERFTATFSGTDANGIVIENGSLHFQGDA